MTANIAPGTRDAMGALLDLVSVRIDAHAPKDPKVIAALETGFKALESMRRHDVLVAAAHMASAAVIAITTATGRDPHDVIGDLRRGIGDSPAP